MLTAFPCDGGQVMVSLHQRVVSIEDLDGGELAVHVHVVPRWAAGGNFMALTAETRVLPPSLTDTYAAFRPWLA
jgi:hypothetical protein